MDSHPNTAANPKGQDMKIKIKDSAIWMLITAVWIVTPFALLGLAGHALLGIPGAIAGLALAAVFVKTTVRIS